MKELTINDNIIPVECKESSRYNYKGYVLTHNCSYVHEGEDFLKILEREYYNDDFKKVSDFFILKSPYDGFVFSNADSNSPEQLNGSTWRFYESIEELCSSECPQEYHISIDDFTKQTRFEGSYGVHILSHNLIYLSLGFSLVAEKPSIFLRYNTRDMRMKVGDSFVLLLKNGETLHFPISQAPMFEKNGDGTTGGGKWYKVASSLCASDIESLLSSDLEKIRILFKEGREPITILNDFLNYNKESNAIFLKHYLKEFVETLLEYGIDYRHITFQDEVQNNEKDNSNPIAAEPCYVYLMKDIVNGYYKIGISNHPQYREHTLQSEKPTIELICAKKYPIRGIAEAFEASLHKMYANKRLRGEWFNLSEDEVAVIKSTLSE